MAESARPSRYMVTKNAKFEAALARYLKNYDIDQILGYDACIEKIGSTINYRFIILGLESLHLPDNPPKIAQLQEPYIRYRDILRAEMINDYPDFLAGNEKLNTLHMRLRVIKPSNKKNKNKKSKSPTADEMETIPSLFDRFTIDNINTYIEPSTPRRSASSRELNQVPLPQLSAALPIILTSPLPTSNEIDPLSLSLPPLDDLATARTYDSSMGFKDHLDELNLYTDRSNVQRLLVTPRTLSDEQRSSRSKSTKSSSKKKANNDSDWNTEIQKLSRYALQKHEDDLYGTLHTPRSTPRGTPRHTPIDELLLSTARSNLTDFSSSSNIYSNGSNEEETDVYCPSVEEVRSLHEDIDDDIKDVDIYFLSLNSKIPELLSAALSNYTVVATFRYKKGLTSSMLPSDRIQYSMESTLIKFSQLKTEIMRSNNNVDHLIKLTDELHNACDKYAKVKELFWKDQDLFTFYVLQFCSCSEAILKDDFDDDIIAFSFSIMKLLHEVFLNTFASPERLTRLKHNHCSELRTLIESLLIPPINLLPVPTRTAADDYEANEISRNKYKIVLQWMFISCALLWLIGDSLTQPSWTSDSFRFQHFIQSYEINQYKDDYFDLFIDALSRLTMNNENRDPLSPKHALYVYELFSTLSFLLINSTLFSKYLRDRYLEEFKYFLKEDIILSRIPVQYPVYRCIPNLIRDVNHRILFGEPNMNLSNRTKHQQLI